MSPELFQLWACDQTWGSPNARLLAISIAMHMDHKGISYNTDARRLASSAELSIPEAESAWRYLAGNGKITYVMGEGGLGLTFPGLYVDGQISLRMVADR